MSSRREKLRKPVRLLALALAAVALVAPGSPARAFSILGPAMTVANGNSVIAVQTANDGLRFYWNQHGTDNWYGEQVAGAGTTYSAPGYPAALFAPAFRLAREHGLPITIHAGEAAGPQSVLDALTLGPRRIGHGVRSAEDPRLLERLASSGVTLEVAITSNVQTGAARSRAQHQLATLVAAGVRVALCTGNQSSATPG
jgi:adenosine deaminase